MTKAILSTLNWSHWQNSAVLPWSLPDLRYRVGFLNRGTTDIFWGMGDGGRCSVHCRVATCLAFPHEMPLSSPCGHDNQKCLEPLPNVPWKEKLLPVENHCYREKRKVIIVSYIFIASQFKKAPAGFNSAGKKKQKDEQTSRGNEEGKTGGRKGMKRGQVLVKEGND